MFAHDHFFTSHIPPPLRDVGGGRWEVGGLRIHSIATTGRNALMLPKYNWKTYLATL
jgi:hypothetical protein